MQSIKCVTEEEMQKSLEGPPGGPVLKSLPCEAGDVVDLWSRKLRSRAARETKPGGCVP